MEQGKYPSIDHLTTCVRQKSLKKKKIEKSNIDMYRGFNHYAPFLLFESARHTKNA